MVLVGHGYGHGIGMGQWGSLGYALGDDAGAGNFTYEQILSHFYGGTTLETLGTAPAPASINGGDVIVAMTENNGDDLIATAASGTVSVAGVTTAAAAVLFHLIGPGSLYDVYVSGGCAGQGGWQLAGTAITEPTAVATNGGPVDLCQPGPSIEVHGSLSAVATSAGQARTVNTLPLEQYVADVAPSESPSTWGALGGAGPQGENWGFQQSEAQTVAARSYVEANPLGYGGYADTCDQACQSYPGMKYETARRRSWPRRTRPGRSWSPTARPRWPPPSTRPRRVATRPGRSSPPSSMPGTPSASAGRSAIRITTGR